MDGSGSQAGAKDDPAQFDATPGFTADRLKEWVTELRGGGGGGGGGGGDDDGDSPPPLGEGKKKNNDKSKKTGKTKRGEEL